jgi:hypothetical protein
MLVMWVIAAVCVFGIVGALASTVGYDQFYGQDPRGTRLPQRSVRRPRSRRPSRQLLAVEAALATAEESRPAVGSAGRPLADADAVQDGPRTAG